MCDSYAGREEHVFVIHQENEGVSVARNVGLHAACGKYIAFIDSEHFISKDYLGKLYETAEDTKADMLMCGDSVAEGRWKNTNSIHMAKKRCTEGKYAYYLSILRSNCLMYHDYIRKIRSIFAKK